MKQIQLEMLPQPDDSTCGPTCLHAVYRYHDDALPLQQVIDECAALAEGGTLGVFLANHALRRGYDVTLYTYNLHVFDPTWYELPAASMQERLRAQAELKTNSKLQDASQAYIEFLELGGRLRFDDLTTELLQQHLESGIPILAGLSSTYLYRSMRETAEGEPDDTRGEPVGHFVVLYGYDDATDRVRVADPYEENPHSHDHYYEVDANRLQAAILLGIATYDANLVLIRPRRAGTTEGT